MSQTFSYSCHNLNKVKHSFSKASSTYAQEAYMQNAMGTFLIELLKAVAFSNSQSFTQKLKSNREHFFQSLEVLDYTIADYLGKSDFSLSQGNTSSLDFSQVLEIGCGPGNFTTNLLESISFKELILNDLSQSMLDLNLSNLQESKFKFLLSQQKIKPLCQNALDLQLKPDQKVDLVVSNATFQWFPNLAWFLQHLKQYVLKTPQKLTRPVLAYSSFAHGTFQELRHFAKHGLDYIHSDLIPKIVGKEFNSFIVYTFTIRQYFKDSRNLLLHLKRTGVNALNCEPLSVGQLKELMTNYQQQFTSERGTYLTWCPYFVVAW